ncbi:MAG: serine protease [Armatimonadota bacterium]
MTKRITAVLIVLFFACGLAYGAPGHKKIPEIVGLIKPAVVTVIIYDSKGEQVSQASGFFVAKDQIVSNRHIFEGGYSAEIKAFNGKTYKVKGVIGDDRGWDIVLLSVDTSDMDVQPLVLVNKYPKEGQKIVVIGSPRGLEYTISDGIISSIRRIKEFGKVLQITAPLSPGSSGSPVVNLNGEVVGVASSQVHHAQNLNFAVPSERVLGLAPFANLKTVYAWVSGSADLNNKIFQDKRLGYRIMYPLDWVCTQLSAYQVVFNGEKGTNAYYAIIDIQVVSPDEIGEETDDLELIVKSFKRQFIKEAPDAKIYNEKPFICRTDEGDLLRGQEFTIEYQRKGKHFKQWQIFLPRPEGKLFYTWTYVTPADQYDRFLNTAKAMLGSWEIAR